MTFKPINDFPGYRVSDTGVVESCLNQQWGTSDEWHPISSCVAAGRRTVNLFRNRRKLARAVHTLVLEAFVGPRPAGMEAKHLDGDLSNCALTNLKWATRLDVPPEVVTDIRRRFAAGETIQSLANEHGLKKSTAFLIAKRQGAYAC